VPLAAGPGPAAQPGAGGPRAVAAALAGAGRAPREDGLMDMLWPHWLRPFWLLLLPLLGWLLWQLWHREKRSGRWQLLLPAAFQAVLLSGGRARSSKLPWIALGLAWLLALLALLGPSWQRVEQASQKRADPLVVLLELT